MKSIKTIIASAVIVAGSLISVAQVNVGTLKVYNDGQKVSELNIEDIESMELSEVGTVSSITEAASSLRRAIHYMLNYSHAPSNSWAPHKYEHQRSLLIDNYAGYWTTAKANFAFGSPLPTLYASENGYMNEVFNVSVPVFTDSRPALVSAEKLGASYLKALALIVQAYGAQELVDFYGVLPMKDLRMWDGRVVKCESGPDVYKQILSDLDEAVDILKQSQPTAAELAMAEGSTDDSLSLFDCQWQRWVKFANSIKLRMAMNMVDYIDPDPTYGPDNKPFVAKNIAEEAYNDEIGVLSAGDRDIAYVGDHECCIYWIGESWNDIRLNASMENILKRYGHPLLKVWFAENEYPIKDPSGVIAPKGIYGVRSGIMMEDTGNSSSGGYGPFARLSEVQQYMSQPLMKVAEVNFLRAEGALRGWNMGGSTKDLYEVGVRSSFVEWGLTDMQATDYLSTDTIVPVDYVDYYNRSNSIEGRVNVPAKWSEDDTQEVKLEKIITQKWIANFPMGAEAWTTFRRTGYPRIFPVKYSNLGNDDVDVEKQIRRLKYGVNSDRFALDFHIDVAVALGSQDICGKPVFWDINSRTWEKGANGQYIINNHLDD